MLVPGEKDRMVRHTKMGICLILIPSRPEKRANSTCTLDCSIWQVQGHYHRFVDFGLQTNNMGCKGLGMLGILLKTWQVQLFVRGIPIFISIQSLGLTLIACPPTAPLHLEPSGERMRPATLQSASIFFLGHAIIGHHNRTLRWR